MLNFLEHVYKGINSGVISASPFIDITKPFDTVDHDILLNKIWLDGIRELKLHRFRSYLINRYQTIRISVHESEEGEIKCGVSQGPV
jgi:hypothetical protein